MTVESTAQRPALLAAYKLGLGVAMCAVAFELFELLDADVAQLANAWVLRLHADPHNPAIAAILGRVGEVDRTSLQEYAAVSGLFGNVHLVEGVGLWLRKHWAEYVCLLSTALFIPLEIYEIFADPHVVQAAMLAVNLGVVWYLACRIQRLPEPSSRR